MKPTAIDQLSTVDGTAWVERNCHWLANTPAPRPRAKRERSKELLILCGHGVSLRIDKDTLLIRNGFTHYPQTAETYRFFRGDLALPARIIMLDGSGSLSFDVLSWLADQRISLVRLTWRGEVAVVSSNSGFAADRDKVAWQTETRADPARRLAFSISLIERKLTASIAALERALPASCARNDAVERLKSERRGLSTKAPEDIPALRGVEGRASRVYFSAWKGLALRFSAAASQPVPDTWREVGTRISGMPGKLAKNERATHPLNAMLNYAYAVLQARVQIENASEGYDPTIGIMHHGYRGNAAYAFDMMEPERPKIDAAVLEFALNERFSRSDFLIRSDGVCRLAPQLARRLCATIASV